jgi:hypothetical protein
MIDPKLGLDYRYSYLRDIERKPIVTRCEIWEGDKILSAGIAICSKKDNPCKTEGRRYARLRANLALAKKESFNTISRSEIWERLVNLGYLEWGYHYPVISNLEQTTNKCIYYGEE